MSNEEELDSKKRKSRVGDLFGGSHEIPEQISRVGSLFSGKAEQQKTKTRVGNLFGGSHEIPEQTSRVGSLFSGKAEQQKTKTRVGNLFGRTLSIPQRPNRVRQLLRGIPQNYKPSIPLDDRYKIGVEKLEGFKEEEIEIEQKNPIYSFANFKMKPPNINIPNFREKVIENIKDLLEKIRRLISSERKILSQGKKTIITDQQLDIILYKAKNLLDKFILKAKKTEITIPKNTNLLKHASAIIYAVSHSSEEIPKLSGKELARLIKAKSLKAVNEYYNRWYKDLAPKLDFNSQSTLLGRKTTVLYFFEQLIDTQKDLSDLISHLEKIDTVKLVSHLKEIIINVDKSLTFTTKDRKLLEQLTEREIRDLQFMAENYSNTFDQYFFNLVEIIKLLIISIKSHKIIGGEFSVSHFVRFFMSKGFDLSLSNDMLNRIFSRIFNYLKNTKYSFLFPNQTRTETISVKGRRHKNVGKRIKLYVMEYIYNGIYFEAGIVKCPKCVMEGFIINTSTPRVAAKDIHHMGEREEGYSADELYWLFTKDRGNPYFLLDLIEKMEREKVAVLCKVHHQMITSHRFNNFKKLISWENIPSEFPYQDIYELPADIIHILIWICVENFPKSLLIKQEEEKGIVSNIRDRLNYIKLGVTNLIQKRYIIDQKHGGVCPCCGEFNTRDHLPSFDFNHLFEVLYDLGEITLEEREFWIRNKRKVTDLYGSLSCSELVREMTIEQGGYVCRNCHSIIHIDLSQINKIYSDQELVKKIIKDKNNVIDKYRRNLIINTEPIKDPLKRENENFVVFMDYLFALYEISERKISKGDDVGITRKEIANYLDIKYPSNVFEERKFSRNYVKIVAGLSKTSLKKYYITQEGKRIVRLISYFRDYYSHFK